MLSQARRNNSVNNKCRHSRRHNNCAKIKAVTVEGILTSLTLNFVTVEGIITALTLNAVTLEGIITALTINAVTGKAY